jgi:3',5'-cyclic AMP phosphodiesterase CpdA
VTTLAHISDLHFGRVRPEMALALAKSLRALAPELVVVSGDLTQRARTSQFRAGQRFLDRLERPCLVVPGNHDLPVHRPVRRFRRPLDAYQRYISPDAAPRYENDRLAVLGLDTTKSWRWMGGGATRRRLERLRGDLCGLPPGRWRVLVTHHPVLPPPLRRPKPWQAAVAGLARECGLHLALSGHHHRARTKAWPRGGLLVVAAGASLSSRLRTEANSYNVLALEPGRVVVSVMAWDGYGYSEARRQSFRLSGGIWLEMGPRPRGRLRTRR